MKKRFKLITTIASLCLAVALMAFGVYAAGTAKLTVNSTVSFSVADVYVGIKAEVDMGATAATAATEAATALAEVKSFDEVDGVKTPNDACADVKWEPAVTLGTENRGVKYVITITNYGSTAITVDLTDNTTVKNNFTGYDVTEEGLTEGTKTLEAEGTYTCTVVADIEDITLAAELVLALEFNISK